MRTLTLALAVVASVALHAQLRVQFERGQEVRVRPPLTQADPPATPLVLKIVAVPGDRIRFDAAALYVNEKIVGGFSPDFLARVASRPERIPPVVPDGHYFVMGEQRINQDISEYWGQHAEASLERLR